MAITAYYTFNANNGVDATDRGNTFTPAGSGNSVIAGKVGNAIRRSVTGDGYTMVVNADVHPAARPFAAWGWMRISDLGFNYSIFDTLTGGLGVNGWGLGYATGAGARLTIGTGAQAVAPTALVANTWAFIYGDFDGTTLRCSVNNGAFGTAIGAFQVDDFTTFRGTVIPVSFVTLDVDEASVWIGSLPTNEDRTFLYNGGSGRSYSEIADYFNDTVLDECDLEDAEPIEANFELLDRGGYGQGSLTLQIPFEKVNADGTERVDIRVFDEIAYRGYVKQVSRSLGNPDICTLTLFSMITTLDGYRVTRKYAYGCPTDVSEVFRDIVTDYVKVTNRFPNITIETETIDVTVQAFDARGLSVAQAFNRLMDISPSQMYWGVDVTSSGEDRVYMRLRPTETLYKYAVGDFVNGFVYPPDTSQIINKLYLSGGRVNQPNLCPNPSFEEVFPASDTVGNLLQDPSFEDGTPSSYWTLSGGATVKFIGHATAHGSPRTGKQWLELDTNGEQAYQTVRIETGGRYTASLWARRETPATANTFFFQLLGLDASDVVITTAQLANTDPGGTGVWTKYSLDWDWSGQPSVVNARILVQSLGGTASNDGILIDDCAIHEYCAAGQNLWRLNPTGNAQIAAFDWAHSGRAFHGAYSVKIQPQNIAVSADTIEIYLPRDGYVSVLPNERYTMAIRWLTEGSSQISFGVQNRLSDYTLGTQVETATLTGNHNGWRIDTLEINTATNTAYLQPFIRARSNTVVYIDAVFLCQGEIPAEVRNQQGYWTGANYERVIDTADAILTGILDSGVGTSVYDYGYHERDRSSDLVTNIDTLLYYAAGQFNSHALPRVEARLSLVSPRGLPKLNGKVKVVNLPSAPAALTPNRIAVSIKEDIRVDIDIGKEHPDEAQLLRMVTAGLI